MIIEKEIKKCLDSFSGKCPEEFNRFVSLLEKKYLSLLEFLSTIDTFSDIRFFQGQIYVLRTLLDLIGRRKGDEFRG